MKFKNKLIVLLLIVSVLFCLTGCSKKYDSTEKHIVNVTVLRTEKKSYWVGKMRKYNYNVYFDVGGGEEWGVNNQRLFYSLKESDEISVFRTDYLKDGKVIYSEFEFIN